MLSPQELEDYEEAHNSFSTAIMLCTALPDGWLSWGSLCDKRARAPGGTAWLDHTVTAYLQVSQAVCLQRLHRRLKHVHLGA